MRSPLFCVSLILALLQPAVAQIQRMGLVLPTDNAALLGGPGADYYQFVDRTFEGAKPPLGKVVSLASSAIHVASDHGWRFPAFTKVWT